MNKTKYLWILGLALLCVPGRGDAYVKVSKRTLAHYSKHMFSKKLQMVYDARERGNLKEAQRLWSVFQPHLNQDQDMVERTFSPLLDPSELVEWVSESDVKGRNVIETKEVGKAIRWGTSSLTYATTTKYKVEKALPYGYVILEPDVYEMYKDFVSAIRGAADASSSGRLSFVNFDPDSTDKTWGFEWINWDHLSDTLEEFREFRANYGFAHMDE